MKKLLRLTIALSMILSLMSTVFIGVLDAKESKVIKTIEYIESLDAYLLENVTTKEVFDAFDNSDFEKVEKNENLQLKNKKIESNEIDADLKKVLVERGLDLNLVRATQYNQDYTMGAYVSGVYGENVKINFTANMTLTNISYQGGTYAQFVKFNTKPISTLGNNSYVFSEKSGVNYQIINGGASIKAWETIQLQTANAISVGFSVGPDWFKLSSSTSTTAYYRNTPKTVTAQYNLPLYSIIY